MGYLRASRDALSRTRPDLEPVSRNPQEYALVIIGGPVWVQTICTPARGYTLQQRDNVKHVALFATAGAAAFAQKACRALEEAAGQRSVATLALSESEVHGDHAGKLTEFLSRLDRELPAQ